MVIRKAFGAKPVAPVLNFLFALFCLPPVRLI
jgi:hypothetical protein